MIDGTRTCPLRCLPISLLSGNICISCRRNSNELCCRDEHIVVEKSPHTPKLETHVTIVTSSVQVEIKYQTEPKLVITSGGRWGGGDGVGGLFVLSGRVLNVSPSCLIKAAGVPSLLRVAMKSFVCLVSVALARLGSARPAVRLKRVGGDIHRGAFQPDLMRDFFHGLKTEGDHTASPRMRPSLGGCFL